MSNKNRNYGDYYKQHGSLAEDTKEEPIVDVTEEVAAPEPEETEQMVVETQVTPTKIIEKTAAVIKGAARVNLRASAGADAPIIKAFNENTTVLIVDDSNYEWKKVEVEGQVGYMMARFLKRI